MSVDPKKILDLVSQSIKKSLGLLLAQGTQDAAQPLEDFFSSVKANPTQANVVAQAILLEVKFPLLLPTIETQAITDFASNGGDLLNQLLAVITPPKAPAAAA